MNKQNKHENEKPILLVEVWRSIGEEGHDVHYHHVTMEARDLFGAALAAQHILDEETSKLLEQVEDSE